MNEKKGACGRHDLCVCCCCCSTQRASLRTPKHGGRYNRYNCIAVDGGMADTACYFNSNTLIGGGRGEG